VLTICSILCSMEWGIIGWLGTMHLDGSVRKMNDYYKVLSRIYEKWKKYVEWTSGKKTLHTLYNYKYSVRWTLSGEVSVVRKWSVNKRVSIQVTFSGVHRILIHHFRRSLTIPMWNNAYSYIKAWWRPIDISFLTECASLNSNLPLITMTQGCFISTIATILAFLRPIHSTNITER
jgi:hypothetical protein